MVPFLILLFAPLILSEELPTSYQYFTAEGIKSGLNADNVTFKLNGKDMFIYSGSMHYFRVPRPHWRDSLKKIRAAGLNTVDTYIAWNLHEPQSGVYDFGNGTSDMQDFLHLEEFLTTAMEEDLFAIVKIGPYICSEFEFGGFPSWLLREKDIKFREPEPIFMKYVTRWFNKLLPILAKYQFQKGGPIIAFQVENEYSLMWDAANLTYMEQLRQIVLDHGIIELLMTSDNPYRGTAGTIPEHFYMTGNFDRDTVRNLDDLKKLQPNRPVMVMEFWSGWYDFWGKLHAVKQDNEYKQELEDILKYPASVNIYMFQGGVNWGFLNGASDLSKNGDENSDYWPITTSYDYSAPLEDDGSYLIQQKYVITRQLLEQYNPVKTRLPPIPNYSYTGVYNVSFFKYQMNWETIIAKSSFVKSKNVVPMELLDINNGNGQSFGYIVYRKENLDLPANSILKIEGRICDVAIILINGKRITPAIEVPADLNKFGTWRQKDSTIELNSQNMSKVTLDIMVENWGRVNYDHYKQYKGLWQGNVLLNDQVLTDWKIYPLEFKKSWMSDSFTDGWTDFVKEGVQPRLYKATLEITEDLLDTYIISEFWTKGILIVNNMVIGRYSRMGPQQTLYIPAPFLRKGHNEFIIFEHYVPGDYVAFNGVSVFYTNENH